MARVPLKRNVAREEKGVARRKPGYTHAAGLGIVDGILGRCFCRTSGSRRLGSITAAVGSCSVTARAPTFVGVRCTFYGFRFESGSAVIPTDSLAEEVV